VVFEVGEPGRVERPPREGCRSGTVHGTVTSATDRQAQGEVPGPVRPPLQEREPGIAELRLDSGGAELGADLGADGLAVGDLDLDVEGAETAALGAAARRGPF